MASKPIKETFRILGWTAVGLGACTGASLGVNESIKACHQAGKVALSHVQNMMAPPRL